MNNLNALREIQSFVPTMEMVESLLPTLSFEKKSIDIARQVTNRNKVIVIIDHPTTVTSNMLSTNDIEYIVANTPQNLCQAIAWSHERIAAIIVKCHAASPYYYKKVRELASAEGALMIWSSKKDNGENYKIKKHYYPDIIEFQYDDKTWIGTRKGIDLLNEREVNQCVLPNGKTIFHVNDYETEFLYNEIFNEETYLQHGITIPNNAMVFDVGANIGLFSLYIKQKFKDSSIFAFEPAVEVCKLLQLNLQQLGKDIKVFNQGLSSSQHQQIFYYYPGYSVISGCYTNQERDAGIIVTGIKSMCNESLTQCEQTEIDNMVKNRLSRQIAYECSMTTLSNIIRQESISKIDLLKIDVEGAELAILKGIDQEDWIKIKQIVIEGHNQHELTTITSMLSSNGFNIKVIEDKYLKSAGIFNIFAIREGKWT